MRTVAQFSCLFFAVFGLFLFVLAGVQAETIPVLWDTFVVSKSWLALMFMVGFLSLSYGLHESNSGIPYLPFTIFGWSFFFLSSVRLLTAVMTI